MNHVLARLGTLCTLVVFVGLTCGCDGELPATKRADLDRQISSFEAKPDCVAALDISRAHEDEREFGRALGFFQKMGGEGWSADDERRYVEWRATAKKHCPDNR
jgi:hypothetical protein